MKKLAFMFVAMMAFSFVSCDENKPNAPETENTDSTVVVDDSLQGDSLQGDSLQGDSLQGDSVKNDSVK